MPRYSTRTLLIAFGLVGLWLATFVGQGAAQDIRRSMLLLGLIGATCLAIFGQGRRRVFWTGFAVVMFLCGGLSMDRPLNRYVPDFVWQRSFGVSMAPTQPPAMFATSVMPVVPAGSQQTQPQIVTYSASPYASGMPVTYASPYTGLAFRQPTVWLGMIDTLTAAWTLALSALAGFVAAYIYSRSRITSTPPPSAATLSAREIVEQEMRDLH